jgi:4-carboxymuconolactone decarboxylase
MSDAKPNLIGLQVYEEVFGVPNDEALTGIREFTINHLFARIWSRPELSVRDRSLITIALLAAQGRDHELKKHITGALKRKPDHRLSKTEVMETMIHVAHYSGWPAGNGGQRAALEVFKTLAEPQALSGHFHKYDDVFLQIS